MPHPLNLALLWPFSVLWHPSIEDRLVALVDGTTDRRKVPPSMKQKRAKAIAWLTARVAAPKLAATGRRLR
jgi:hypothetical protein